MFESPITPSTSYYYDSDILGNRSVRGDALTQESGYATYAWDEVNRLKKHVSSVAGGAVYKYRADGMRTEKVSGVSLTWYEDPINDSSFWDERNQVNAPTTRYYYDGQMAVEEDFIQEDVPGINGPTPPLHSGRTRYGLGARGVDMIDRTYDGVTNLEVPDLCLAWEHARNDLAVWEFVYFAGLEEVRRVGLGAVWGHLVLRGKGRFPFPTFPLCPKGKQVVDVAWAAMPRVRSTPRV